MAKIFQFWIYSLEPMYTGVNFKCVCESFHVKFDQILQVLFSITISFELHTRKWGCNVLLNFLQENVWIVWSVGSLSQWKIELRCLMIEWIKWWRLNVMWCVPCREFYIKKMKVSPRTARGATVPGVVRVPKHSHPRRGRLLTRRSGREFALSHSSLSNLSEIIFFLQIFLQLSYSS